MMMEDLLGADSNQTSLFSPAVMQRTASSSYFDDAIYFAKDASLGNSFDMEGTLEFNELPVPISFHDFVDDATPTVPGPATIDVEAAFFKKEPVSVETPPSSSALGDVDDVDDEEDSSHVANVSPNWERELEKLINEFDGQVPIDEKLKRELLQAPVREFNRRAKALKLEDKTIHYLKVQRKRDKNRRAAIRSRSRKETQVVDLQGQVDQLTGENKAQKQQIYQLQQRVLMMEREMCRSRARE